MRFNITAFGAVSGTSCTEAVQRAFDAASKVHGTVIVPSGVYEIGTVDMGSASLLLERGGVLRGSPRWEDYRPIGYSHNEMGEAISLLYAMRARDITISGEGRIEMNGSAFFDFDRPIVPEDCRQPMTRAQLSECTIEREHRPNQPMFFYDCHNITVRDITITDAPCWTIAFIECSDVKALDLVIDNSLNVPNCDGMHFCSCRDMFIRGCRITSGDDCVAFSGITNWDIPCERAVVSDCIFQSASKAISIGYMHSIVRDITVTNCVVVKSNRAVAMMANAGTGLVENVALSNLRLDSRVYAGNWWGHGEPICLMSTPHDNESYRDKKPADRFDVGIRRVLMQNLSCTGENAIALVGENGSVQEIDIDHIHFARRDSANLELRGHMIDLAPGPQTARLSEDECAWLYLCGVRDVSVTNWRASPWHGKALEILEKDCENVKV